MLALIEASPFSFAAAQCQNQATQAPPQAPAQAPGYPPAPPGANGAVVYNPWYPGNVVPFFSAYPFVSAPYLIFDRPIPPPIPAPPAAPQTAPQAAPQSTAPPCRCGNQ